MSAQVSKPLWLTRCWYQIAWSHELVAGAALARTVLDTCIVMFRAADGTPQALLDRCPHRFAPLSEGKIEQDVLRCGYHGLAFDGSGRCVGNPHGAITSAMRVRSFPLVERHHALWVWPGTRTIFTPRPSAA